MDWHGQATASLSALSYSLHAELAAQYGGEKWGFRRVDTLSITTDLTERTTRASPLPWLPQGTVHHHRSLGTTSTTSQVHPQLFTREILQMFLSQPGTRLIKGTAIGYTPPTKEQGNATATTTTTTTTTTTIKIKPSHPDISPTLQCTHLLIAAGPWTGALAKSFFTSTVAKSLSVSGSRAHSVVIKTKERLTPHALFTDMTLEDGDMAEPEVYARPDGTVYICGASDNEPLPPINRPIKPDPFSTSLLLTQAQALSPVFSPANSTTLATQACFLPTSERGRPLIGRVKGVENVWVASGHSCWGITQGPGTGLVVSEMMLEGRAKSADISKLAP